MTLDIDKSEWEQAFRRMNTVGSIPTHAQRMDQARELQAEADAFDFRAKLGEEAIRQLDMLRVTLQERMRVAEESYAADLYASDGDADYHAVRCEAYKDVLTLLGPEPAWAEDESGNPF